MNQVVIIGCGVVGGAIAYELSRVPGLKIALLDEKVPASGSTGAALGVLMGAISHKIKGRAWQLRQASLERYETLIPELESLTGMQIPFNRQGIVMLRLAGEELERWEKLREIRRSQGWELEIWDLTRLQAKCPQIQSEEIIGAVYSPCDRQVNPTTLTQALVAGASRNGVNCHFGVKIQKIAITDPDGSNMRRCDRVYIEDEALDVDWLVIAAGLGSTPLTASLTKSVDVRPVLGQALQLKLNKPLGNPDFQPVITGDDLHIVPIDNGEYWVGATVEFPDETGEVIAKPAALEKVRQVAISFCPTLAEAKIVRTWFGKRPRPEGEPAPIIGQLPGYGNVLLATGHYRNGVLLAPATALAIRETICKQ
ncbi:FAD-dependent oxidoreductase [Hydrococcus rivularis NIES-593]|uniref:FAD-dependent oxidoreductase n=1 Tax=Hydrococcus rivularis NIES-593 TaxID=1921803 RepID=A0A1U7H6S8_9CYAN|nr:FAD-dependent oxidoreductase [Hydrococcus rivularis]OKH17530.1 FAD-dependent oxidoreductase [Hydrococcus rivularis NIES-593]